MAIRCYLFLLAMIFISGKVYAQDQRYIDSLKQKLNSKLADTTRATILEQLANLLPEGEWEVVNDEMEKFVTKKLVHASNNEQKVFNRVLAGAYNNKSLIYKYKGETAKALEYGEKSLALFSELNDMENISNTSYNNGRLYYSLGNISKAVNSFESALKIISSGVNKKLLPYCLNMLGYINKEQQDLEKAIEFHQKAYVAAQQIKDDEALAYTASCIALVQFEMNNFSGAEKNFKDALAVYRKIGDVQNQAAELYHLGQVEFQTNRYSDAIKNCNEALLLYIKRRDQPGIAATYNLIGQLYFKQGLVNHAEDYLKKSLAIGRELGFPTNISTPAEGLYRIYRQKGDTKKALDMHELFVSMRDSVNNEATRKKILKAQYRYEFEMKASADSIIVAGEKKLLHAQLSEEKTQRYALFGGLVLLIISTGFGFTQFRTAQRLKEMKLRNQIASDLHDEVGSAISSISLLAGLARIKHGSEAQHFVSQIEETSHETINTMSDIVWNIEPANDSFDNVLRKMKQFGVLLTAPLNISFSFSVDPGIEKLSLDMMQRKNIYLIYKESVNNACKHAHATTLDIKLQKKSGALLMHITDNGLGFDTTNEYMGHGLKSLKARALDLKGKADIISAVGSGTSISISIPL